MAEETRAIRARPAYIDTQNLGEPVHITAGMALVFTLTWFSKPNLVDPNAFLALLHMQLAQS
jgi:hypothetical protein